jgi:polyisoprenoid-binding protein YceI
MSGLARDRRWPGGASRPLVALALAVAVGVAALGSGAGRSRAWPGVRPAEAQTPGGVVLYVVVPEASEARYRVREQLVGLSFPNDAVGATKAVEGAVALDGQGRIVAAQSRLTIDLRTLTSDEPRRDNYLRQRTLETDRFPTVTFVPTEVGRLPTPLPTTGSATFEIVGDLTVRDTTRRVTWETTATFRGPRLALRARTIFRFADVGLTIPRVSVVLSVADHIQLEADLTLAVQRSP